MLTLNQRVAGSIPARPTKYRATVRDPRQGRNCCWAGDRRESGGTGRRAGFRCQWGNPWEFDSPLSHQRRHRLARLACGVRQAVTGNNLWTYR